MTASTTPPSAKYLQEIDIGVKPTSEQLFYRAHKRYSDYSYQIAFKITGDKHASEDITQDIFLKVWQHREKLLEVESVKAYLTVLIRNSTIDYMRKRQQNRSHISRYIQTKDVHFDLADQINQRETEQLLQLAIQELSPHRKAVFVLVWLEGRSRNEVAARFNVSPHTVKNLMQQARRDIQVFFTKHTGMKRVSVLKIMKNVWCKDKVVKVAV
jgi:RNA polymerase sigma-70 factor (ECF subfamily)